MLKIRLARGWKHKSPFYRIVLTEHTKPVKSGYQAVLGWFDPLHHETKMDIDLIKEWIGKWAQPSNRVAKLARKFSDDTFFDQYIVHSDRVRRATNAPDEPEEEEVVEEKKTSNRKVSIQRYKGLGEMNAEQLWDTTMDPDHRKMYRVTNDDAEAADMIFSTLMGSEVAPRRQFIQTRAKDVTGLDI